MKQSARQLLEENDRKQSARDPRASGTATLRTSPARSPRRAHWIASPEAQPGTAAFDDRVFDYARRAVGSLIRQLVRAGILAAQDQEDLEQEILFAVYQRLARFDPSRGELEPFIAAVVKQSYASLRRSQRAAKRSPGSSLLSITTADGIDIEPVDSWTALETTDLAADVDRAILGLPNELRSLALLLPELTASEVAQQLAISRATLYRRLEQVRTHLRRLGLHRYVVTPRLGSLL